MLAFVWSTLCVEMEDEYLDFNKIEYMTNYPVINADRLLISGPFSNHPTALNKISQIEANTHDTVQNKKCVPLHTHIYAKFYNNVFFSYFLIDIKQFSPT